MIRRASLCLLLLAGASSGQIPWSHFLVSARGSGDTGAWLVDPQTGDLSAILGLATTTPNLTNLLAATASPVTGDLYLLGGAASSLLPIIYRVPLSGGVVGPVTQIRFTGLAGLITDLVFRPGTPDVLLATLTGTANTSGLWAIPTAGGAATMLGAATNCTEIAMDANDAYVLTKATGVSTIWRYTFASSTWSQIATGLPESSALDLCNAVLLLVGTVQGQFLLVDPLTGLSVATGVTVPGAIIAIRQHQPTGITVAVTDQGAVYRENGTFLGQLPAGRTPSDLETGLLDQASFFTFGTSCPGSAGPRPAIGSTGLPVIPSNAFGFTVAGGLPSSVAVHALGSSRGRWAGIPLPLDLTPAGAPGCTLLVNGLVLGAATLSGSGAGQIPFPVPNNLALRGITLVSQWWVYDPLANAMGFAFSEGGEAILR